MTVHINNLRTQSQVDQMIAHAQAVGCVLPPPHVQINVTQDEKRCPCCRTVTSSEVLTPQQQSALTTWMTQHKLHEVGAVGQGEGVRVRSIPRRVLERVQEPVVKTRYTAPAPAATEAPRRTRNDARIDVGKCLTALAYVTVRCNHSLTLTPARAVREHLNSLTTSELQRVAKTNHDPVHGVKIRTTTRKRMIDELLKHARTTGGVLNQPPKLREQQRRERRQQRQRAAEKRQAKRTVATTEVQDRGVTESKQDAAEDDKEDSSTCADAVETSAAASAGVTSDGGERHATRVH